MLSFPTVARRFFQHPTDMRTVVMIIGQRVFLIVDCLLNERISHSLYLLTDIHVQRVNKYN